MAGYLLYFFAPASIFSYLTLEPYYILHGQIWRLVTWILIPPESPGIFTIIMLFFYYSLGNSLEQTWGAFRYNVYIFMGMISYGFWAAFLLYVDFRRKRAFRQCPFSVPTILICRSSSLLL